MKKWIAFLSALILSFSLSAFALADEPQYTNTRAVAAYLDSVDISYTFAGKVEGDETIYIGNTTGEINYDFALYFTEDNETVYIRVWNLITFDPARLDEVLRTVNQVNSQWSFTAWYVYEEDSTIVVRLDLIVREGDSVQDIVMEGLTRMHHIIKSGCEVLASYAK